MSKLDLTKAYKSYYTAKAAPQRVTIEKARYISISGKGDPNSEDFASRTQALYVTAYSIKKICQQAGKDFTVSKLEGFWWVEADTLDPLSVPREEWCFEIVIRMPDYVTTAQFEEAQATAIAKKKAAYLSSVQLVDKTEGECVQLLHTGPFSEEPASLEKLYAFIKAQGLEHNGKHHEIYLSDYRKTAPEKLKTILRHPVREKA